MGHTLADHSSNWAVLVDTSRYWFNYRHVADTLSFYHTVKSAGIPDSHIILMLADDMACNPRNSFPAQIFNSRSHHLDLYGDDIEVDFRGTDVSVENFIRVLTGRQHKSTPKSKRLLTDENSNILIYMAGHGGDEFLKFQDQEEISSQDLADAFEQMRIQKRYNEILFIVDTCQASTLHKRFQSPNVVSIGSSALGENSYSHHVDNQLGVSVIDRFTYHALDFFENNRDKPDHLQPTIKTFFETFTFAKLRSNAEHRSDLFQRDLAKVPTSDFFSAVIPVDSTPYQYPLAKNMDASEAIKTPSSKPFTEDPKPTRGEYGYRLGDPMIATIMMAGFLMSLVCDLVVFRSK